MSGFAIEVRPNTPSGLKRTRSQLGFEKYIENSTKVVKTMQAGAVAGHMAGQAPRGLGNSKSMGQLNPQPPSSSEVGQSSQQEPVQQPGVVHTCLDDLSSRVEIYKGRHSIVWNAVCKRTRKPVILKGYVKEKMTERNFHQVRREIRLMQIINYDGAVKLLGHFEDESTIYLVQEQCAKGDLFKKLIRNGGALDEKYVAGEVVLPMLLTLEYCHARMIYHRDIKPENIFFTREGKFKLGDFGLAIDASLERSKSRVGTLDYMSPEVVSLPTAEERKKMEAAGRPAMEQPYGEKCDIWACGVLAYELMVGRPPFEVKDESETRKRIMYETTLKIPPHITPDAVNFIKTALAKNAGMRPSASELIHHPWLRPYLLAMAQQATGQLDPAGLSAYKNVPSLGASCSAAVASAPGDFSAAPIATSNQANQGSNNVGRSASFTGVARTGMNVPGRLQGPGAATAVASANGQVEQQPQHREPAVPHSMASHLAGQLQINTGGARPCSPVMPTTPGPYGPPGMSRKPVWETDKPANTFTAVRTVGLSGEVPSSPTSPRVTKPSTSMFSAGGGNPLLKAALNANLNRIHTTVTSPGSTAAAAQQHSGNGSSMSTNVKQRLRDYFVARNPEVAMGVQPSGKVHQLQSFEQELGRGEEQH